MNSSLSDASVPGSVFSDNAVSNDRVVWVNAGSGPPTGSVMRMRS